MFVLLTPMARRLLSQGKTMESPIQKTVAFSLILVIGLFAVKFTAPDATGREWSTQFSPHDMPSLDWSATPAVPPRRIKNRPLDMTYSEVEALLLSRMSHRQPESTVRATAAQIIRLCHLLGLQPSFVLAVIEHESGFRSHAISPAGAKGLMQLLPATARVMGNKLGIDVPHGGPNLHDPVVNVTLGMHYLAELQDQFESLASTLAAYNLGPKRWADLLESPQRIRPGTVAKYIALIQRTTSTIKKSARLLDR